MEGRQSDGGQAVGWWAKPEAKNHMDGGQCWIERTWPAGVLGTSNSEAVEDGNKSVDAEGE